MTDIIIKRYRPEEFPRHLDFLERMTVTKGTVEDWHALKSLHYKTDGKPFAPTYYRCELDDRLVGVVVMAYPKLLLAPRHRMFPKLKPTTNTTVANQYWGRYVNNNFAVISRSVVDTQYRGVGVSYRMINLVSRMHDCVIWSLTTTRTVPWPKPGVIVARRFRTLPTAWWTRQAS